MAISGCNVTMNVMTEKMFYDGFDETDYILITVDRTNHCFSFDLILFLVG